MAAKKSKLIDYLNATASRQLLSVKYQLSEETPNESLNLTCTDEITTDSWDDNGIVCTISRKLKTEPEFLSIDIIARVIINIKKEYKGKIVWENIDVKEEIGKSEYYRFFSDPFSRISLLISNLTASFSGTPIVTPVYPAHADKV